MFQDGAVPDQAYPHFHSNCPCLSKSIALLGHEDHYKPFCAPLQVTRRIYLQLQHIKLLGNWWIFWLEAVTFYLGSHPGDFPNHLSPNWPKRMCSRNMSTASSSATWDQNPMLQRLQQLLVDLCLKATCRMPFHLFVSPCPSPLTHHVTTFILWYHSPRGKYLPASLGGSNPNQAALEIRTSSSHCFSSGFSLQISIQSLRLNAGKGQVKQQGLQAGNKGGDQKSCR